MEGTERKRARDWAEVRDAEKIYETLGECNNTKAGKAIKKKKKRKMTSLSTNNEQMILKVR